MLAQISGGWRMTAYGSYRGCLASRREVGYGWEDLEREAVLPALSLTCLSIIFVTGSRRLQRVKLPRIGESCGAFSVESPARLHSQSLWRMLGTGGPSMHGIALRYS